MLQWQPIHILHIDTPTSSKNQSQLDDTCTEGFPQGGAAQRPDLIVLILAHFAVSSLSKGGVLFHDKGE